MRALLVALLGLLALSLGPAPAAAQKPRAERPTYAIGERWIRTDGAYDLVRIEGDTYVFAAEGGREVHLSRDLGLARIARRTAVDWDHRARAADPGEGPRDRHRVAPRGGLAGARRAGPPRVHVLPPAGLKGAADRNGDGIVTLQELYEYLDQEVTRKARAAGGNQHPVMKGEMEGQLPLVRVRSR